MFCKIVIDNDNTSVEILRYLEKYKNNCLIVTQEYNEILENNDVKAKTVLELIPETSEINSEIIKSACKKIFQYKKMFEEIKYKDLPIFDGLENFLTEESIWVEKITKILNMKRDILLVLKDISFSCFTVLKIAKELGYSIEENFAITVISNNKIKKYSIYDNFEDIEKSARVKKAISIFINSKKELGKATINHFLKRIRRFDENSILQRIEKKIQDKIETIFFLATDIDDFLIPYYKVIEKCSQRKIKFKIVSIDLTTRKYLKKHKLEFLDLFDEIYILQNIVKNSDEFKTVCNKIEDISKKHNMYVLNIEKLSTFVKTKIAHSIAITIVIERILGIGNPKSVCIGTDGSTLANVVANISHMYKIRSLSIEPGILNEGLERENHYKADIICIYGKQGAKVLENIGYERNRIYITGNPRYDSIRCDTTSETISLLEKKYGIKKKSKKIMVAMSRWHKYDDEWISELIKKCNMFKYSIIIKIHPIYSSQNLQLNNKFIKSIKKKSNNMEFAVIQDINSSKLLDIVDLVITDYSNVGIETMLRGIPLITVNFDNEDTKFMQKFHQTGIAMYVTTITELNNKIDKIFREKSINSKSIQEISELFNFKNDRKATDRIFELLVGEKDEIL